MRPHAARIPRSIHGQRHRAGTPEGYRRADPRGRRSRSAPRAARDAPPAGPATYASGIPTPCTARSVSRRCSSPRATASPATWSACDEIEQSMNIVEQLIDNIPEGEYQLKMKPVIRIPEGSYYAAVEGSRGEFGVFIESRGDKSPYRMKFRSTGLPLVSCLETIAAGDEDRRPDRHRRHSWTTWFRTLTDKINNKTKRNNICSTFQYSNPSWVHGMLTSLHARRAGGLRRVRGWSAYACC